MFLFLSHTLSTPSLQSGSHTFLNRNDNADFGLVYFGTVTVDRNLIASTQIICAGKSCVCLRACVRACVRE